MPAKLGDGQDPHSNLYWGAMYGVRGYFGRQAGWKRVAGSHPLLLTTGLMAPEAYTLDAALRAWIGAVSAREAAAIAYDRYQQCGPRAARRLFWSDD